MYSFYEHFIVYIILFHLRKCIIAKASVRSYNRLEKFLMFVLLSVCMASDSSSKKLSDSLQTWHKCLSVMQNQLYSFWCILPKQRVYRDTQKYLNTLQPMQGNSFYFILVCITHIQGYTIVSQYFTAYVRKFFKMCLIQLQIKIQLFCIICNEIYVNNSDAQQNSLYRKRVYIVEIVHLQRHTKEK